MTLEEYINILNSDIKIIKGIGEKKASLLYKLGINSVWDVIYNFPRNYDDRTVFHNVSDAPDNTNCCIKAVVRSAVIEKKIKPRMSLYILRAEDYSGFFTVKWFSSPFNKQKIKRGKEYTFYGHISRNQSNVEMTLVDIEECNINERTGKILPLYRLTNGLSQNDMRKFTECALKIFDLFIETLPLNITDKYKLLNIDKALRNIHFPHNNDELETARYRFAFEELFILCLAMKKIRSVNNKKTSVIINNVKCVADFAEKLPFELTVDQKKAVNDICMDFKKNVPMNRLIQGDVGSGKTAVAACAAYAAVKNGYQVALMAPTEILAYQHYETFKSFFASYGYKVEILTASGKDKKEKHNKIKNGDVDIVIGTHALIQKEVKFCNLGLCITDEQHRFGVKQRAMLSEDSNSPHVLVMSATPIPRTLSLVVYSDLDITVIKSLPKNRQKIDTFCIDNTIKNRMYNFINDQLKKGNQCYFVCPLIENSETIDATSGNEVFNNLKEIYPDYKIRLLHGKLSQEEKDSIMSDFKNKKFHILVSTTVIEVGIDVPNATVMVIENAERFGLSQLHQLRGRVGRGSDKSYCILVSEQKTEDAKERMKIISSTSDGFEVANSDLLLRGCGEFFGTKQHGLPELKIANLFTDLPIVESAKNACEFLLLEDPDLIKDEYIQLRKRIDKMFSGLANTNIFN